ncbi:MAG: hypothetical protein JWL63_1041 [Rhodocyclales bacterium]|nr:hypothetical protein [Rhodocyclales bacterium]
MRQDGECVETEEVPKRGLSVRLLFVIQRKRCANSSSG